MENVPFTIGFIGFGLIGGSIAKGIRLRFPDCRILVSSRTLSHIAPAKADGIADQLLTGVDDSFAACDYIFLCTPVSSSIPYLEQLAPMLKPGCILTDVGSVKGSIHKAVHSLGLDTHFIGGHPMAGSEKTGYANANAAILQDALYILTPTGQTAPEQLQRYQHLISQLGCRTLIMDPGAHDRAVAGISHVPHLAAASLAQMVLENDSASQDMHRLASTGFLDTTRIAASSPEMWEQICAANAEAISSLLTEYIHILTGIRDAVKDGDSGRIETLFQKAGAYRSTFTDRQ